jgi:hypothetical protein
VPKSGSVKGIIERLNGETSSKALIRKIDDGIFDHHGHAGPAFIERLASDRGALHDAQDLYDETREELARIYSERTGAPATTQEERILSRFALVAAAGRLAVRFEILPFCESEILRAVMSCASDHLARRGSGEGESSSLEGKFRKFIVQNAMGSFEHLDNSLSDSAVRTPTKSFGWVQEGTIYMTRETLAEALGVDPKSTKHAKILAQSGLLLTEKDGTKTRYNVRAILGKSAGEGGRFFAAPYAHIINSGSDDDEKAPLFDLADIVGWPDLMDTDWLSDEAQIIAEARKNTPAPEAITTTADVGET